MYVKGIPNNDIKAVGWCCHVNNKISIDDKSMWKFVSSLFFDMKVKLLMITNNDANTSNVTLNTCEWILRSKSMTNKTPSFV